MVAELSAELIGQVEQAAQLLQSAKRVCILTGAGISAESGIPTFRDKQTGLWEKFRAEDLASPVAFARDPKLVWSWYQWRRQLVHDKAPNPAHQALAQWQAASSSLGQHITLITQNVDDLHEQAGSDAIHLHGHLWKNRCSQCDSVYEDNAKDKPLDFDEQLITCPHCGSYIRPDIVWFGEALPVAAWQMAEEAAANCDVFMSIGTSSLVYPAAGLAQLAKQNGAKIIEVNPNPTPSTVVDITLAAKAGAVMPVLINQLTDKTDK
ncbi:MAG: SIR2 family NAD-dependent protein deacylase [Psychrobacter sp.]|uniref:SIR2 family NAD-dependent protein deacylase n=1 Tax=Psychrobacter submarinus TaxID=154108 RepID=UPI00191A92A2|nr:NAD-dependent deacylase [Psychrobacter submarinus]